MAGEASASAEAAEQLSSRAEPPSVEQQLEQLAANDPLRDWIPAHIATAEGAQGPRGSHQPPARDSGEPAPESSAGIAFVPPAGVPSFTLASVQLHELADLEGSQGPGSQWPHEPRPAPGQRPDRGREGKPPSGQARDGASTAHAVCLLRPALNPLAQ